MNIINSITWYSLSTLFTQLYDTETYTFTIIMLFTYNLH